MAMQDRNSVLLWDTMASLCGRRYDSGTLLDAFLAFLTGHDKHSVRESKTITNWAGLYRRLQICPSVLHSYWGKHVINFILKELEYCPVPKEENKDDSRGRDNCPFHPHPVLSLFVKKWEKGLFQFPMLFLSRKIASFLLDPACGNHLTNYWTIPKWNMKSTKILNLSKEISESEF